MFQRIAAGAVWNAPAYFEFREHRKITLSTPIPHTFYKKQTHSPLYNEYQSAPGFKRRRKQAFIKEDEA